MVARGDLGVESRLEDVAVWQKKIIAEANKAGKLVITATQMLESMIQLPMPTRAEVSDVTNAVIDGTCAVMLSGETAVGWFPVETISAMRRIVNAAERSKFIRYFRDEHSQAEASVPVAIARAAIDAAEEAQVKAIILFTLSGSTARFIAKRRPKMPILALTPNERVYHQMNLYWGVIPFMTKRGKQVDTMIKSGKKAILDRGVLKKGDMVLVVFGTVEVFGGTNQIKIVKM